MDATKLLPADPDADDVRRMQAGDPAGFDALYRRYVDPLRVWYFVRLREPGSFFSPDRAEDLAHEALLRVWQHRDDYDDRGYTFKTWLFAVARNVLIDAHKRDTYLEGSERHAPVLTTLPANLADLIAAQLEDGPEACAERSEDVARLRAAIASLRPTYRAAVVLRHLGGLRGREVARRMGVTETNARVLAVRGVAELRARLGAAS